MREVATVEADDAFAPDPGEKIAVLGPQRIGGGDRNDWERGQRGKAVDPTREYVHRAQCARR